MSRFVAPTFELENAFSSEPPILHRILQNLVIGVLTPSTFVFIPIHVTRTFLISLAVLGAQCMKGTSPRVFPSWGGLKLFHWPGQLGRMMVYAAHRLGVRMCVLDPLGAKSPAGQARASTELANSYAAPANELWGYTAKTPASHLVVVIAAFTVGLGPGGRVIREGQFSGTDATCSCFLFNQAATVIDSIPPSNLDGNKSVTVAACFQPG